MENLGGTLRTMAMERRRKRQESIGRRCKVSIILFVSENDRALYNTTRLKANWEKLTECRDDRFCPNVQASTMGIIGLSQNASGNSEEIFEGVFYPLAYKREYNQNSPVFAGDCVWPSFVRVSSSGESCIIEKPCGDAIVWFLLSLPLRLLMLSPSFSRSLSLPLFVRFWYADRLTLKRGSHGDKKGPLTSLGTRQTPVQRRHAILKS